MHYEIQIIHKKIQHLCFTLLPLRLSMTVYQRSLSISDMPLRCQHGCGQRHCRNL